MYLQIRCVIAGERPPRVSGGASVLGRLPSFAIRGCAWTMDSEEVCETLDLLRGGVTKVCQRPKAPVWVNTLGMSCPLPRWKRVRL
jgi:hypothetical protein